MRRRAGERQDGAAPDAAAQRRHPTAPTSTASGAVRIVATSRARSKIKHYIHSEEKERSLDLGRKLFEKEARRYGLNLKALTDGPAFTTVLTEYGYGKAEELYAAIRRALRSPGSSP